jgi:oligopeptide transport system substrate-binding protein
MRRMFGLFLVVPLLLLLAACQSGASGPRIASEGWQPTPQATQPLPPTLTPVPTATLLAVEPTFPAEIAVTIPTRPPTPQPDGLYVQETTGFTIPYPVEWNREESDMLAVLDPVFNVRVTVSAEVLEEGVSFDSFVEEFSTGTLVELLQLEEIAITEEGSITVASGEEARIALITAVSPQVGRIGFWLAYIEKAPRAFSVIAVATPANLEARQHTLQTMVKQIAFVPISLFGLNRDETLVLLGGDPLPRSLDPARTTGSAAGYVGLLYSGLVRLSPEMQVIPDLAETWDVSQDGTVYTFTLRDGLKFSSGRPLTSADIVYSLERATDPDTGSSTAATYLGDILGAPEKLSGEADTIAGLEIIDDRTLQITLDGPKPYFLAKLTYPTSYVVDQESVRPNDEDWVFDAHASGPYVLREFREQEAILFSRNEAYHNPPAIPHVVYLTGRVGSAISLYESGEVDIIGLGSVEAQRVRRPSDSLHDQWISTTSMCTSLVQMNNSLPPFDDLAVRQAFALAVDKSSLNDLLSDGMNLVATTILPPAMPGHSLELAQSMAGFDVEAAQAALAQSAYADGLPPITILAAGFGDSERDDLNALVDMWREILGAEVTVRFVDPINFTEAMRNEEGHMVSYGWCADYPDPENFLDVLYYTGGDFNVSGYSNPAIDAILRQARTTLDPAERLALYQEAEALLLADVAAIPLLHGVSDELVKPKVKGYISVPMGAPIIPLLSLEPTD